MQLLINCIECDCTEIQRELSRFRLHSLSGRGTDGKKIRRFTQGEFHSSPNDVLDLSKIPYARCFNNEAKDLTPRVSPLDSLISKSEFLIGYLIFYL